MKTLPRHAPAFFLAGLVLLASPALAQEQTTERKKKKKPRPLLWMIEGETPSFLFGTIHLPEPKVLDLPKVVLAAVDRAQVVYTELDIPTLQGMERRLLLPPGKNLKTILPKDLLKRSKKYLDRYKGVLARIGQSPARYYGYKVWAFASQLMQLEYLQFMLQRKLPMDLMLPIRAMRSGKQALGLETADEQLKVFDGVSEKDQIEMLRQTLDALEEARKKKKRPGWEMVDAYLKGDLQPLLDLSMKELSKKDDADASKKFIKALIDDRNVRMADRIAAKVNARPGTCFFFAVGAAHYPGKMGVLKLLRKKGFKVRRLTTDDLDLVRGTKKKKPTSRPKGDF